MKKVLVVIPVNEEQKKAFLERGKNCEISFTDEQTVTKDEIQNANIIIGNVKPELLAGSSKLEWIQLNSAGTDGYLKSGVLPNGAIVTNATGAYGLAISEHMLAMTLMLKKKLGRYHDNMKQHLWQDEGDVTSIYDATTLVVGLGNIGSEYAKRMALLGSRVMGVRKHEAKKPEYLEELGTMEQLDEMLSRADIVAVTLPGTKETYHLFDEARFQKMKPGAVLINVGRGSIVDNDALYEALKNGTLMAAGIDVVEGEPLDSNCVLWDCPNLLITPHISGGYHLPETFNRICNIATDNLEAFLNGKPLQNEVDWETGYRKFKE